MAAVTPYEPVDYQQFSTYRPYQLPINDIFKAVSAQNQYWDEGAYRVKSVYDNALNLSLSKDENKKIRDQFVKQSEEQLAKLSTMNLADPSVQRMGIGLYNPLFKDRAIISDHGATEHIRSVNAAADQARKNDNGKYYSQYNHQYALQGVKEFMDSPDRNAGEAYLKQAKNYEPFYDYTEEYKKVEQLCPADSESGTLPYYGSSGTEMTGYLLTTELKERTASKAYNCLLSNLSGRAIRQLQIEGSVTYRSMPIGDFGKEIIASYNDQLDLYEKKRQQISASIAGLNSKDNKMTADQKRQAANNYSTELDKINTSIAETTAKKDKLIGGDYTDVYDNFDSYAANIYTQNKLWKEAVSLAFREYTREFSGDPVQLQAMRQKFESAMQSSRFQHERDMQANSQAFQARLEYTRQFFKRPGTNSLYMLNPDLSIGINPNVKYLDRKLLKEPDVIEGSIVYNGLTNAAKQATADLQSAKSLLFNNMVSKAEMDPQFRKTFLGAYGYKENELDKFKNDVIANKLTIGGKEFHQTPFMAGTDKQPGYLQLYSSSDPSISAFNKSMQEIPLKLKATETRIQLNEKEVLTRLRAKSIDEYLSKELKDNGYTQDIKLQGMTFTPLEAYKLSRGETIIKNGNVIKYSEGESPKEEKPWYSGLLSLNEPSGRLSDRKFANLSINGKVVQSTESLYGTSSDFQDFRNWKNRTSSFIFGVGDKLEKIRNEVYRSSEWNNSKYIQTFDNESPLAESLQLNLSSEGKANKTVSIAGFTGDGEVLVSVPFPGQNVDVVKRLQAMGLGEVEDKGNNFYSIKGAGYNVIDQPANDPYLQEVAGAISGITSTKSFELASPGTNVANFPLTVRIKGVETSATLYIKKIGENNAEFNLMRNDPRFPMNETIISAPNGVSFINQYSNFR